MVTNGRKLSVSYRIKESASNFISPSSSINDIFSIESCRVKNMTVRSGAKIELTYKWSSEFFGEKCVFGRNFWFFGENFYFWRKICLWTKHFIFWGKILFLAKIFILGEKIYSGRKIWFSAKVFIFVEIFYYYGKFLFLANILMFRETFDSWRFFLFLTKSLIFWRKFWFLAKNLIFGEKFWIFDENFYYFFNLEIIELKLGRPSLWNWFWSKIKITTRFEIIFHRIDKFQRSVRKCKNQTFHWIRFSIYFINFIDSFINHICDPNRIDIRHSSFKIPNYFITAFISCKNFKNWIKNLKNLSKIKIFAKNQNFRQKSTFSPKNQNFRQKSTFSPKNQNFRKKSKFSPKFKIFAQNQNFCQKSKFSLKNQNFR